MNEAEIGVYEVLDFQVLKAINPANPDPNKRTEAGSGVAMQLPFVHGVPVNFRLPSPFRPTFCIRIKAGWETVMT